MSASFIRMTWPFSLTMQIHFKKCKCCGAVRRFGKNALSMHVSFIHITTSEHGIHGHNSFSYFYLYHLFPILSLSVLTLDKRRSSGQWFPRQASARTILLVGYSQPLWRTIASDTDCERERLTSCYSSCDPLSGKGEPRKSICERRQTRIATLHMNDWLLQ